MRNEEEPIEIVVPQQGVNELFESVDEGKKWFRAEATAAQQLMSLLNENVSFAGNTLQMRIGPIVSNYFNPIVNAPDDQFRDMVARYAAAARSLRVIVAQGDIGRAAADMAAKKQQVEAAWTVLIFSADWVPATRGGLGDIIGAMRVAALATPATRQFVSLSEAKEAVRAADDAELKARKSAEDLTAFIKEQSGLINNLVELYRTKLVIEEPAIFWQKFADKKTWGWRGWLCVFALAVALPIGLVFREWSTIGETLHQLTTNAMGGVSVAGVALISVPALMYAWLLKNLSRLFIQNLNAADDAAHRRALAITYLGLAENPKLAISETERALILNALFRPGAHDAADDGPPVGLLDLLKGSH